MALSVIDKMKINKDKDNVYDLIVDHIYQSDTERKKVMKLKYEEILNKCLLKIVERYNLGITKRDKLRGRADRIYFKVPRTLLGLEKFYSLEDCIVYVIVGLKKRNFDAFYSPPNIIMITWINPEDETERLINQAILEKEYEKTVSTFAPKKKISEPIKLIEEPKKKPNPKLEALAKSLGNSQEVRRRMVPR